MLTYESYRRRLIYLRGYAAGKGWTQTVKALHLIIDMHDGQMRNDGLPFASHPVMVASLAVAYGIGGDPFVAACLLHDVIEDTIISVDDLKREKFSTNTLVLVALMTKVDEADDEVYFGNLAKNPWGMLLKILDRMHNMSTMIGVFKHARARRFIDETNQYLMPFFRELKKYPEVISPDTLYALKYALEGLVDAASAFYPEMQTEDAKQEGV